MTETNVHPGITFRITGYHGTKLDTHANFPDGSFEHIKAQYPIGSEHAHVPAPPCRYEVIHAGVYDEVEARRQLYCRACYPKTEVVDNRKRVDA